MSERKNRKKGWVERGKRKIRNKGPILGSKLKLLWCKNENFLGITVVWNLMLKKFESSFSLTMVRQ